MGILSTGYDIISALIVLIVSAIAIPVSIGAWFISVLREWKLILLIVGVYVAFYFVGIYGATAIDKGLYGANKVLTPYYEENIRPILYDIIGRFYNRVICWLDGLIYFPYGFGRFVIFPIVRDGGGASTVLKFVVFMKEVFVKLGLEYFLLVNFINVEADFTTIHVAWIDFYNGWQSMLCYGCEDLCPLYTKFPIFPMIFTSDQWKDPDLLGSIDDLFNGFMIVVQQTIKIVKQFIYGNVERWVSIAPRSALLRPDFRRAFDLWVRSGTRFWKSCETAMNTFWTNFVPVIFRWEQMFTPMVYIQTTVLRMFALTIQLVIHHKEVFEHFSHTNSTYWIDTVKEDYKEIIGLIAPASNFAPISLLGITTISHYDLDPTSQAKPNGLANPLFGVTTLDIYQCVVITRILCDPGNVGVTCAQKYQGTLLEDINLCCPIHNLLGSITDFLSIPFEISLHLFSANDLMRSADKQPFTTVIKDRLIGFFTCFYEFFRVVPNYGYCIEKVLLEITNFILCTGELLGRVLLALLTLPYYERFMPGECNFISCGQGVTPVAMAVKFLDRIADTTDPNGMINCLSFLLDTGFQVPFAGCNRTTCDPSHLYIPPLGKKRRDHTQSIYNRTAYHGFYAHSLTPIMNYHGAMPNMMQFPTEWIKYQDASSVLSVAFSQMQTTFGEVYDLWGKQKCDPAAVHEPGACAHPDLVFQRLTRVDDLQWNPFRHMYHMKTERLETQPPTMEVNCPTNATVGPCFDIACLAKKVTELSTHTVAFSVRAANAFIQSRTANGSTYFTGEDCLVGGSGICLQKDLTEFIVDLIAPIDCLCQLIKLLLPNKGGFEDPCCAFTIGGELLSCTAQVIINIGNSIGGDAPNYTYITNTTKLQKDFVTLLKLALATFDCVCNFIRKIFAVVLVGAGKTNNLAASFDPCCIPRTIVKAVLAATNMFFKLVMSMSTLKKQSSQCYMYVKTIQNDNVARLGCVDGIPMLPVMRDFALITNSLFSTPPENDLRQCGVTKTGEESGNYGGATCVCRLVNSILAMLFKAVAVPNLMGMTHNVTNALDDTTAPTCYVDLCCPIYRISQILENSINFVAQFTWSFVQDWQDKQVLIFGIPTNFWVPMETFNFFFCDEYGPGDYFAEGTINTAVLEIQQPGNPLYGEQIFNPVFGNNDSASGDFLFNQHYTFSQSGPLDAAAAPGFNPAGAQAIAACLTYTACTTANPGNYNICGVNPCPRSPTQNVDINGNIVPIKSNLAADVAKRKCGKLEPIIIAVYNLLSRCLCPSCTTGNDVGIGNLADNLLQFMLGFITSQPSTIFPFQIVWPKCFCCGGPSYDQTGIVVPFASALTVFFRQILILARNIANPNYWAPGSGTLATNSNGNGNVAPNVASSLADNLEDIKKTWISRFLAPFADALCRFFTNSACLLSMLLGQSCSERGADDIRYKVISSIFAYVSQALIRFIAIIEAAVKLISQELPGQCVGNPDKTNYNANLGTNKQGNNGFEAIPTCSQRPITSTVMTGVGAATGTVDPQDIGRILVSILTFIVDAFIGVAKLGCTTICPGLQFINPMENLGSPGTCACYNLSPYIGVTVSRCTFKLCADVYNFGGAQPFSCLTGDPQKCDGMGARYGHTNMSKGFFGSASIPVDNWLQFVHKCQDGCENVTGFDVSPYDGEIVGSGSRNSWEVAFPLYKFIPRIIGDHIVCQSQTYPASTDVLNRMKMFFGTSMQVVFPAPFTPQPMGGLTELCYEGGLIWRPVADGGPATSFGYANPEITPPFTAPSSSNPYTNDVLKAPCPSLSFLGPNKGWKDNIAIGGINYARDACLGCLGSYVGEAAACNHTIGPCNQNSITYNPLTCVNCLNFQRGIPTGGLPQSPDTQSVCNRKLCTTKGWCKNDQLVPCARGYGQPVLDGVVITALKYIHCLIGRTFGSTPPVSIAGDVIKGIIKGVLFLLSFIWQLSGGFIRFGVAVFVFNLRWMQGLSGDLLSLSGLATNLVELFNAFADIFRQPVIADVGKIPEKKRFGQMASTWSMENQLENLMKFEDAHDCIDSDNIRDCFCKTINVGCELNSASDDHVVVAKVATIFDDNTECSSVWKHISDTPFKKWKDVTHSARYEASVCLTKRSRGESWRRKVDTFPENYFYNSRGTVDWIHNIIHRSATKARNMAEEADAKVKKARERLEETHSFKKRFGMTHTQYLQKLNIRYEEMRRHLMKDHGYTPNSYMLDPLMMLDSYWYRYQSGYWGHLGGRALNVLRSGDLMLGAGPTFTDTIVELGDSYDELKTGFKMALPHLRDLFAMLPEPPEIPTPIHIPTWPWNLPTNVSHVWHGIKERMPEMEMPTFNWGPKLTIQWPLELPSVQWNDEIVHNWNKVTSRFIVGGNCRIYDGAIEQGRKIIDYCSTEFVPHLNRRPSLPNGAVRPRLGATLDYRELKRASAALQSTRINLHDTVISWVESIFGISISSTGASAASSWASWFANPNLKPSDFKNGDTGFLYWATFELRCEFPENLDCKIGIGLREAIKQFAIYYGIAIVAIALFFPGLVGILAIFVSVPVIVAIIAGSAWHYSFACTVLFPSVAISPLHITLPIWPVPLNILPALPFCMWDEILDILGEVFASDYKWIPDYMFYGDRVGFIDCRAVGVSDGLENLLFFGYQLLGGVFLDVVMGISSTVFVRSIVPGFSTYMQNTINAFRFASPTLHSQQLGCAIITAPAMLLPLLVMFLLATLVLALSAAIVAFISALLAFFRVIPFVGILFNGSNSNGDQPGFKDVEESDDEEDDKPKTATNSSSISNWIGMAISRRFGKHKKME